MVYGSSRDSLGSLAQTCIDMGIADEPTFVQSSLDMDSQNYAWGWYWWLCGNKLRYIARNPGSRRDFMRQMGFLDAKQVYPDGYK